MSRATRILSDGIYFGEGPRWRDGRLWFSDILAHAVKSVSPDGDLRTEFVIDDQPSGLGWMPDGSMLIVSMTKRHVLRRSTAGVIGVHADLSHIAAFHCNDMVVEPSGGAFVGNFGFDLDHEMTTRGRKQVYADHPTAQLAYVAANGEASVAASEMHFPNGSVITPDGKTLIVAETLARMLDGLRRRRRRSALQPPSLGHDFFHGARWDHAGCGSRHLDRQSGDAGMRADCPRRKGLGSHRHRTTVLCVHAGRRRRAHPVHADGSARERYRPGRPAGRKAVGRRSRGPTRRPSLIVTAREGRRSRLHLNERPTKLYDTHGDTLCHS